MAGTPVSGLSGSVRGAGSPVGAPARRSLPGPVAIGSVGGAGAVVGRPRSSGRAAEAPADDEAAEEGTGAGETGTGDWPFAAAPSDGELSDVTCWAGVGSTGCAAVESVGVDSVGVDSVGVDSVGVDSVGVDSEAAATASGLLSPPLGRPCAAWRPVRHQGAAGAEAARSTGRL